MEKFIYIMSCQRGQGLPEIHYLCDNYDEAIDIYYKYYLKDDEDFLKSPNRNYWFMYLYKLPIGVIFSKNGDLSRASDTKLGRSSEYRIKFNTWGDLINEWKMCNRNSKIDSIL